MKNHTKYSALVTTSLLIVALAGPANATPETNRESTEAMPLTISAPADIKISYEKTAVTTTPAVYIEPPAPVEVAPVVAVQSAPVKVEATTSTPAQAVTPTTPTPAPVVSASGKGATIAAAAYAQLGVAQDCTALASNSLAAAGINFHGWPRDYFSLGSVTASPQAGDLIYYDNAGAGVPHIAVYVGNGMAIHGGWNGGTTALFKADIGSGATYIRVA